MLRGRHDQMKKKRTQTRTNFLSSRDIEQRTSSLNPSQQRTPSYCKVRLRPSPRIHSGSKEDEDKSVEVRGAVRIRCGRVLVTLLVAATASQLNAASSAFLLKASATWLVRSSLYSSIISIKLGKFVLLAIVPVLA